MKKRPETFVCAPIDLRSKAVHARAARQRRARNEALQSAADAADDFLPSLCFSPYLCPDLRYQNRIPFTILILGAQLSAAPHPPASCEHHTKMQAQRMRAPTATAGRTRTVKCTALWNKKSSVAVADKGKK